MAPAPGSLGSRLRGIAAGAIGILQTRLELLATELQEEKLRLGSLLGWAAAAFFLLGFGVILLALFLTVLLWDSHRLLALGVFTALFLCGGLVAVIAAARAARQGSRLFAASLAELSQDRELLRPEHESESP
ncbi:MAG TPA: phage holin family protein [Candidatus Desulfobacillus sp.]|nr:phage holin family protein [Candidatus Desulfobacillus sp.]